MKTALITGITGQDGSYLAELLLRKGYRVFGVVRKSSSFNTGRIDHLQTEEAVQSEGNLPVWARYFADNFYMIYGDLMDGSSIARLIYDIEPDEVYNLGAQAHVRVSFDQPELTMDVNAMGNLRLLTAIESLSKKKKVKFYQASSSEMFGNHPPGTLLDEQSIFRPCSPYAIAKTAAYWQTVNYRERGLFAVNGVMFNHETITSCTPMIYKFGEKGEIDIAPISDVCKKSGFHVDETQKQYQVSKIDSNLYVWDRKGWTLVKYASAYPKCIKKSGKPAILINARNAVYAATQDHVVVMSDGREKLIQDIQIGDKIFLIDYPTSGATNNISREEARLLGALVGDGSFSKYTSSDQCIRDKIIGLWSKIGDGKWSYNPSVSGFTGKEVGQIVLRGSGLEWFKKFNIYTKEKGVFGKCYKRVPKQILNSSVDIQCEFLEGYNLADGLKKNPCKYLFKNFKTNSPILASGLLFLVHRVTGQQYNITVEQSEKWGKVQYYYSINLLSNSDLCQNNRKSIEKYAKVLELVGSGSSQRAIQRKTGISIGFIRKIQSGYIPSGIHYRTRDSDEVKKIITMKDYDGWFYDLETESGTFHCGIGQGVVHNSPRRGATYVTRKITRAATRIYCGLQNELALGNLKASRDWGFADDYVRAMYLMMQHDKPDDFVVATGISKTVQDFLETVFSRLNLDISKYVRIDKRYFRDIELNNLKGNASKIRSVLGWKPSVGFDELVDRMIESDMALAESEK